MEIIDFSRQKKIPMKISPGHIFEKLFAYDKLTLINPVTLRSPFTDFT